MKKKQIRKKRKQIKPAAVTPKYDQALLYYSKVLALDPNNALAYYNSGLVSKAKGDSVKAKEFIQRAASLGYNPK
jgi:tetratricopeptide (TPR) repeat protein